MGSPPDKNLFASQIEYALSKIELFWAQPSTNKCPWRLIESHPTALLCFQAAILKTSESTWSEWVQRTSWPLREAACGRNTVWTRHWRLYLGTYARGGWIRCVRAIMTLTLPHSATLAKAFKGCCVLSYTHRWNEDISNKIAPIGTVSKHNKRHSPWEQSLQDKWMSQTKGEREGETEAPGQKNTFPLSTPRWGYLTWPGALPADTQSNRGNKKSCTGSTST